MIDTRNILVTGGAGFIGCNFVHYWLQHHPADKVVVLDALTYAGNLASLDPVKDQPNYSFVHGNIGDGALVEKLLRDCRINTIVHLAAESHVDRSITGPDAFLETNIIGTHCLLKAAKKVWIDGETIVPHRFHHVSTDEVYGTLGAGDPPFTETTPYAPNSPYAASKASSDHFVRAYHETYGLQTTISNCSNNYGPYQFPEKLIPLIVTNILHNKPLPVYGDGLQIRDWLYVEDHCRGLDLVIQKGVVGQNYNIGGHNEWKNIDIVKLVCRSMDQAFADHSEFAEQYPKALAAHAGHSSELITYVTDRLGHDRRYAIDAGKTNFELKYAPAESFETGIAKSLHWYLQNEGWWLPLVKA
ncbi:dTDP-glucose 4,6-dehydratase [Desulfocastanea catecholica]